MKKVTVIFTLIVSVLFIFSCNCTTQGNLTDKDTTNVSTPTKETVAETPVEYTVVTGYFVKNTYKAQNDINLLLPANQTDFNNLFGMAKTMDNKIETPDFEKSTLVAVILKETDLKTNISVSKIVKINTDINIYLTVEKGEKLSYTSVPNVLLSIPKYNDASNLHLFINNEKISEKSLK